MLSAVIDLARLLRAGFVLAREGVFSMLAPPDLPPGPRAVLQLVKLVERRQAREEGRLAAAFAKLGPSYIKLGQFLATRRDIVGAEIAADLELLQDRLPPFPMAVSRAAVEDALGAPIERLFESFGEPVAAASMAQVHRATIRGEGPARQVAVKVLRPDVDRRFAQDLRSFTIAARLMERLYPPSRRLRPLAVVDNLAQTVAVEMDLRLEAAAISEMEDNIRDDPDFRVPAIDWTRTARRVLTTEWIEGVHLSDHEGLKRLGLDLSRLAVHVLQTFLRHAMRDGFFHADMHPGNLFVDAQGRLVAIDLGITGRLSPKERRFLAEMLYGFIKRDYLRVAEVHFEAEYVPPDQSVYAFAQALRAVGEPVRGKRAADIAMSRLLTQLFEVTDLFQMRTRPELILLQKTMVVVEGVARGLDPDLDMWRAAEPVVEEWIRYNLGPVGRLQAAAEGAGALARFVSDVPEILGLAERGAKALGTGRGVPVAPASIAALIEPQTSGGWKLGLAVWIAALALLVIAVQSLTS